MTQRTCNIIMCCKGHDKYGCMGDPINSIKHYMGEECMYPWEKYTDSMIESILIDALMDYIDGVNKPSFVLLSLRDVIASKSLSDRIAIMFSLVQVCDENGECINGFTEQLLQRSREILE